MHQLIKAAGITLSMTFLTSWNSQAQSHVAVSVPFIYSRVDLSNNWSPPTAVNRRNSYQGASVGYGATVLYSFHPDVILGDSRVNLNVGIGYFKQRFNLARPFDYNSSVDVIFYTDHYAYDCLQGIVGLSYSCSLGKQYSISGNISYQQMRAFRQQYTPRTKPDEISHHQTDFGRMLLLSIGLSRDLGERFMLSAQLLAPVYTRWRNDKVFKDDPTTFSQPRLSFGSAISLGYYLKERK